MDTRPREWPPTSPGIRRAREEPPEIDTISRDDFIEEFIDRFEPGQHAVFLGPTGRGKTLLMRHLAEAGPPMRNIGVLLPKGRNKTLDGFGMRVHHWPGSWRQEFHRFGHEPPYIWMLESDPKGGPQPLRSMYEPVLRWARGRPDWLWIIPDLQALSDPKFANVGKDVSWLLLTLREYDGSIWMDAQRPAWIPRESEDQVSYVITFRNTDEGTQERLGEILSMPRYTIEDVMKDMDYHDFLWRDNIKDEVFFVKGGLQHQNPRYQVRELASRKLSVAQQAKRRELVEQGYSSVQATRQARRK